MLFLQEAGGEVVAVDTGPVLGRVAAADEGDRELAGMVGPEPGQLRDHRTTGSAVGVREGERARAPGGEQVVGERR